MITDNSFSDYLEQYILDHTEPESELLKELYRETHVRIMHPRMCSGHLQGKILQMLCHMVNLEYILEIGTFTGYSAICMAQTLPDKGELHTIEINDEIAELALSYFKKANLTHKIHFHIGDALKIIPEINRTFDLVFIDGEKKQYLDYYNLVFDKVRKGGFIIADNVLWSGKVVKKDLPGSDHFTRGILAFNDFVQQDGRVQNVLFPIHDGLMVIKKLT
ncbi:MAG: O-methyltransferase [Bacteroidia bacterium]|nr:O-methyltransferase [Bacteroidia bacterium]